MVFAAFAWSTSAFKALEPADTSCKDFSARDCIHLSPSDKERFHQQFLALNFSARENAPYRDGSAAPDAFAETTV